MEFVVKFKVSEKIYLKDPDSSELGMMIVVKAVDLIHELGFEAFTFRKLAADINTTEATIYRYFENKHRVLLYIFNWYWSYLEFTVMFKLQSMKEPKDKLISFIELICNDLPEINGNMQFDTKKLHEIIIAESSKVFLVKAVNEINKELVFKPYKDLCNAMSEVVLQYNPKYKYPHSLISTIVETAHSQQFFVEHLPRLTDRKKVNKITYTEDYLKDLIFKSLG